MTLLDELQRRNVPLQLPRREIDIRILLRVFAGVKDECQECVVDSTNKHLLRCHKKSEKSSSPGTEVRDRSF